MVVKIGRRTRKTGFESLEETYLSFIIGDVEKCCGLRSVEVYDLGKKRVETIRQKPEFVLAQSVRARQVAEPSNLNTFVTGFTISENTGNFHCALGVGDKGIVARTGEAEKAGGLQPLQGALDFGGFVGETGKVPNAAHHFSKQYDIRLATAGLDGMDCALDQFVDHVTAVVLDL